MRKKSDEDSKSTRKKSANKKRKTKELKRSAREKQKGDTEKSRSALKSKRVSRRDCSMNNVCVRRKKHATRLWKLRDSRTINTTTTEPNS